MIFFFSLPFLLPHPSGGSEESEQVAVYCWAAYQH